ncbi:MAG: autotransporter-associated beta strand repeat-containing protein, partial [Opitutales bacterium]
MAVAGLLLCLGQPLSAQSNVWLPESESFWILGPNWLDGVPPDSSTTAAIQDGRSALVVTQGQEAGQLFVGISSEGNLTVENNASFTGAGTLNIDQELFVAVNAGVDGNVTVDGSGASLTAGSLDLGSNGDGDLIVENNAQFDAGLMELGSDGGNGALLVRNNAMVDGDTLDLGQDGVGTVTVESGADVTIHGTTTTGTPFGSADSLLVDGAGSTFRTGDLELNATGDFADVRNDGILEVSGGLSGLGSVFLNTGTLRFTDNSTASSIDTRTVEFGSSGNTLEVAAATETVVVHTELEGVFGFTKTGPGTLEIRSTSTYGGDTRVSAGELLVTGGGSITNTSGITIDGPPSASASLRIDGSNGGGLVETSSNVQVGTAQEGTLFLVNGGNLTAPSLSVNASSQVRFDGGIWTVPTSTIAPDNLVFNGDGTFTVRDAGDTLELGAGSISGPGDRITAGSGTVKLVGDHTPDGDTVPTEGLLQLGDASHDASLVRSGNGGTAIRPDGDAGNRVDIEVTPGSSASGSAGSDGSRGSDGSFDKFGDGEPGGSGGTGGGGGRGIDGNQYVLSNDGTIEGGRGGDGGDGGTGGDGLPGNPPGDGGDGGDGGS